MFALIFLQLGLKGLFEEEQALESLSVTEASRGDLPDSQYLALKGGQVVIGEMEEHFGGKSLYAFLLDQGATQLDQAKSKLDLSSALEGSGAARALLVKLSKWQLQELRRNKEFILGSRHLGPLNVTGMVEPLSEWPNKVQERLIQGLGLRPDQVLCVAGGEEPPGIADLIVGVLLFLGCAYLGRRLWRSGGFPDFSFSTWEGSGGCGKLALKLGAVGVFLVGLIGQFGGNAARSSDELTLVSRAVKTGSGGVSQADDIARLASTGLDLMDKAKKSHSILSAVFDADQTMVVTILIKEYQETFEKDPKGVFQQSSLNEVQHLELLRDGKLVSREADARGKLAQRGKGEYRSFQITEQSDGQATIEIRMAENATGQLIHSVLKAEAEFVQGDWDLVRQGGEAHLQYTQEGILQAKASLAEIAKAGMEPVFREEFADYGRWECDVEIQSHPNVRIRIQDNQVTMEDQGPTLIRVSVAAWK